MLTQFLSPTVAFEMIIAVVWFFVLCFASKYYSKALNGTTRSLKADYLKTPTATALTVLGLLLPILVALTSYLYATRPSVDYGSLLTTIVLYFIVLIIAIWETFAILKKAGENDVIAIIYPRDRRFITGLGLMYGGLLLGLFYFAYFFLFEIRSASAPSPQPPTANQLVRRPALLLEMSRDEVRRAWGTPARSPGNSDEYEGDRCRFVVTYDGSGKIQKLTAER
jgi:hypothetical protein